MAEDKWVEKRVCKRFEIPGTTLNYSLKKTSDPEQKDTESWDQEFCPVLDISCGGIKFQGKKSIKINSEIIVKTFIPGERNPLLLQGEVRWLSTEENKEKFEVGVQFKPYGEGKDQNYPGLMVKLLELEHKYASTQSDISKYEIDS
jgi:hypothetical protein